MLDLAGVNAKISRAQQCLQALDADIEAFCEYERRKHVFAMEQRLQPVLHSRETEPLVDYAVRVGEIAYNLRSALDHLVWQLVIDNGEDPTRQNQFPIFFEEGQYSERAKDMLKGVKEDRSEMIHRLQPFQENSVAGAHLWMLNSICNIDKHRYLTVVDLHSFVGARMKERVDPDLAGGMTGGLALYDAVKGTEEEGKVEIQAIVDACFIDEELEKASVGYGSALEEEGMNRPSVRLALAGCLTAVKVVVEWLHDGHLPETFAR